MFWVCKATLSLKTFKNDLTLVLLCWHVAQYLKQLFSLKVTTSKQCYGTLTFNSENGTSFIPMQRLFLGEQVTISWKVLWCFIACRTLPTMSTKTLLLWLNSQWFTEFSDGQKSLVVAKNNQWWLLFVAAIGLLAQLATQLADFSPHQSFRIYIASTGALVRRGSEGFRSLSAECQHGLASKRTPELEHNFPHGDQ